MKRITYSQSDVTASSVIYPVFSDENTLKDKSYEPVSVRSSEWPAFSSDVILSAKKVSYVKKRKVYYK